jgi:transposase
MAKSIEHTETQIAQILREARSTSINEAAIKYNVSEAAICAWHAKFGRLGPENIKRLRNLKLEQARRKRAKPLRLGQS